MKRIIRKYWIFLIVVMTGLIIVLLPFSGITEDKNDILTFKGTINSLIVNIDGYDRTFNIKLLEHPQNEFIANTKQLKKCNFKDGEAIEGKRVIFKCKKKSPSKQKTYFIINCTKID